MVRALALFMLVFSLLCLVVHLQALGGLFGIAALAILAIDLVVARFFPRPGRVRGEPIL
jgi:hypothetical protein